MNSPPAVSLLAHDVPSDQAAAFCGGLLGCASVDGGPTEEQARIIVAFGLGLYGEEDACHLLPVTPEDVALVITDPRRRHRLIEMMIVLEFACHPAHPSMIRSVERYAEVLGVDEDMLVLGRDALRRRKDLLQADFARFAGPGSSGAEGALDVELASRLRSLERCAPGTLGRAFFDFYRTYDLPFPGEPGGPGGGQARAVMTHDFTHVLADYEPVQIDELALQAMLVAATDGDAHFGAMVAILGFSEVGMLEFPGATPQRNLLMRPGAVPALAEGVRRGRECRLDFEAVDHLSHVDEDLSAVRRDLRISPRLL